MVSHPPETCAQKLSSRLQLEPPTDLDKLASAIGLTIQKINSSAYEGIMKRVRGKAIGVIGVRSAKTSPERMRFTLAHEIGHYVLGRNDFEVSICKRRDIGMSIRNLPEREILANRFAAEVLLPAKSVYEETRGKAFSISRSRVIARKFGVSLTAAAIRYAEVTEQPCAVVVTIDRVVRFFKSSKSWTRFIQVDCLLSKETVAYHLDIMNNEATDIVKMVAWSGSGRIDALDDVRENSIYLPSYNTILTILSVR